MRSGERLLRKYPQVRSCHGGDKRGPLMGPYDAHVRARRSAHLATVREALRPRSEERYAGCSGHLEAASRPEMRFVPQKSVLQQDMQMLHRIRSRPVANRTQLGNQIRGLLAEYGLIVPLHLSQLRKHMQELISAPHPELTAFAQDLFAELYEELCSLYERIAGIEKRIHDAFNADESCQRIADIEGVG